MASVIENVKTNQVDLIVNGYNVTALYRCVLARRGKAVFHAPLANGKTKDAVCFNLMPIVTCGKSCLHCGNCGSTKYAKPVYHDNDTMVNDSELITGCANGCYALNDLFRHVPKALRISGNVEELLKDKTVLAWADNTALALFDMPAYENAVIEYLEKNTSRNPRKKNPVKFARIHASGDFFSWAYADMWYRIAKRFENVQFLAFTKAFDNIIDIPFDTLDNFSLVLSSWPGLEIPVELKGMYPIAYAVHSFSEVGHALQCPGNCSSCHGCWYLAKLGKNVAFVIHGAKASKVAKFSESVGADNV